jgi:hypothetical protein
VALEDHFAGFITLASPQGNRRRLYEFRAADGATLRPLSDRFPGLTPYGRVFKIKGYTTGGGPGRTTPFSAFDNYGQSEGTGG